MHSDMNESVPGNILVAHKEKRLKRKIKLYIVQFYDKTSSWCVSQFVDFETSSIDFTFLS